MSKIIFRCRPRGSTFARRLGSHKSEQASPNFHTVQMLPTNAAFRDPTAHVLSDPPHPPPLIRRHPATPNGPAAPSSPFLPTPSRQTAPLTADASTGSTHLACHAHPLREEKAAADAQLRLP